MTVKTDLIKQCEKLVPERIKLQFRIVFSKRLANNPRDMKEILELALLNAQNIKKIGAVMTEELERRLGELSNA